VTGSLARLVFPSLRWRRGSFAHEEPRIARALAARVGGFIIFGGTRAAVTRLTRDLRRRAQEPILVGADVERGVAQQLPDLTDLPPPAALGFVNDLDATHAAGIITAREALAVGINWAFAPVCDLDWEVANPIVGTRSFGAFPERVGAHAAAWIRGAEEHGVLACAKHYPGHGRTTVDSHASLPVVDAPGPDLLATDVRPFAAAVAAGVSSVMSAHVAYPGWDPSGAGATFSSTILGYLRGTLGFTGMVVTDALIMAGATSALAEAPATVAAVAAGCDALLYPLDFERVVAALDRAVGAEIPAARAAEAMERIDQAAARSRGFRDGEPIDLAAHAQFADGIAARALYLIERGRDPIIPRAFRVTVVDDDVGGPYTVGPRDIFERALRAAGRVAGARGSGRVVTLYAEPRSWKGRAALGERTLAQLAGAGEAALVVLFGHPRLATQIPGSAPVLVAWHGQPLMQRAAARWIVSLGV
jgi:beta-glucosidase